MVDQMQGEIVTGAAIFDEQQSHDNLNITFVKSSFVKFITEFNIQLRQIYKDQLIRNQTSRMYQIEIDLQHVHEFDKRLFDSILSQPADCIRALEDAMKLVWQSIRNTDTVDDQFSDQDKKHWQVLISSQKDITPIKQVDTSYLEKLVRVSGIIVSISRTFPKAVSITGKCTHCGHEQTSKGMGLGSLALPRQCMNPEENRVDKCPADPQEDIPEKCSFIDVQYMKIQETPEELSSGDIPKHLSVQIDRAMTDVLCAGSRVTVTGIMNIQSKGSSVMANLRGTKDVGVHATVVKAVGLQVDSHFSRVMPTITDSDKERFLALSRQPDCHQLIFNSMSPSIYGHEGIKKAIACQLFGGVNKTLSGNVKTRGDLNILLLGDPSTAKSQFLKFAEKCAPVSVFTSGKGSSAAGLTAAIIKNNVSGEFHLEGGAMVLGDGGIVCIDEFDKMRPQDRVAIHEAMEQQTISISKAGINAMLNTRVSVLAAANPLRGKYNDLESMGEQLDFQTTILSRFDMIFLVKDVVDQERDRKLVKHVFQNHTTSNQLPSTRQRTTATNPALLDIDLLRKYIIQAKSNCNPKLTQPAKEYLTLLQILERNKSKNEQIPLTARQLEALIRISEALARMTLSNDVTDEHVQLAQELFKQSTLSLRDMSGSNADQDQESISRIEQFALNKVTIGHTVVTQKLLADLNAKFPECTLAINIAITNLIKKGDFEKDNHGKILIRRE